MAPVAGPVESRLDWLVHALDHKTWDYFGGIHDLLLYETPKVTRIRDAKLGILYYLLVGLILTYLAIQLGTHMEFLDMATPSMTSNFAFEEPVTAPCVHPIEEPDCKEDYRNFKDLSYCCDMTKCRSTSNIHNWGLNTSKLVDSCVCPGHDDVASFPCNMPDSIASSRISNDGIFVKTYREWFNERQNPACNKNNPPTAQCNKLWLPMEDRPVVTRFSGDIESFTITVQHDVSVEEFSLSSSTVGKAMEGYLRVGNSKADVNKIQMDFCQSRDDAVDAPFKGQPTSKAPCYVKPERRTGNEDGDLFQVEVLLNAMGVSLDDLGKEKGITLRTQGFRVDMEVVYYNYWPWHGLLDGIYYYYKLKPSVQSRHEESSYKTFGGIPGEIETMDLKREVEIASGMLLMIAPAGRLAVFSFQHLLVTLTTAMAMLAVATWLVTIVARFLLRWSQYYALMIYDTSGDFGHLSEVYQMSEEDLTKALAHHDLPTFGTHEERALRLLEVGSTALEQGLTKMGHVRKRSSYLVEAVHHIETDEESPLLAMDLEEPENAQGARRGSSSGAAASSASSSYGTSSRK